MCIKHEILHKELWMDACGALYMNKRMEREGKMMKTRQNSAAVKTADSAALR